MAAELRDELAALIDSLDEDAVASMDKEEVLRLRKKINPFGRTIQGSGNVLTFSAQDMDKTYKTRFLMTGMVGFLNRMCDEWHVPDGMPVVPVYDYLKDPTSLDADEGELERETEKHARERAENVHWMQKRIVVKEFLEHLFQFNPDEHVRSSYIPDPKNKDRVMFETLAGKLAIQHRCRSDPVFADLIRAHDEKQRALGRPVYEDAKAAAAENEAAGGDENEDAAAGDENEDAAAGDEDAKAAANEPRGQVELKLDPVDPTIADTVREMIPPSDTFHRWNHYMDANYEQLLSAVADLYCEVPHFELAVNPYDWHENLEDADAFIHKHRDEVVATIHKAESGKWNVLSKYQKARDSTRYFNDNTIVLEEIMAQMERDAKIGKDLMKKRIEKKKRENIKEDGPDDPMFAKWKKHNAALSGMGAEHVNQESYADDECPDDGIQVDVFRVSHGGKTLKKSKFYSQAEAPSFMNDRQKPKAAKESPPESKEQ